LQNPAPSYRKRHRSTSGAASTSALFSNVNVFVHRSRSSNVPMGSILEVGNCAALVRLSLNNRH
jgi:hypothetical protein